MKTTQVQRTEPRPTTSSFPNQTGPNRRAPLALGGLYRRGSGQLLPAAAVIAGLAGVLGPEVATAQPAANYADKVLAAQPHGYWRLNAKDDPSSGSAVAVDASPNGLDGTYGVDLQNGFNDIAGPRPSTYPGFAADNLAIAGVAGAADSYVHLPKGEWPPTNTVTFTMWIYPDGEQGDWTGLMCSRGGPVPGGIDYHYNKTLGYIWNDDSTWSINSKLIIPTNQWSFVAVAIEPTNATLYLNYVDGLTGRTNYLSYGNKVTHKVQDLGAADWRLGTDFPGSRNFNGMIDEAAVFLRTLSASEITALFAAGLGMNAVAPTVSQAPASKTIYESRTVHFTAAASGTPSPSFQWQVKAGGAAQFNDLKDSATVSGAKTASLTLSSVSASQAGEYRLVASNPGGSAPSASATLTVLPVPATGNYATVVQGLGPRAYWRLGESYTQTNTVDFMGDFMGTYQSAAVWGSDSPAGAISGPSGASFPGFEASNTAVQTSGDGSTPSWVLVPTPELTTNAATFIAWITPSVDQEPNLTGILMIDANYQEPGLCFNNGGQLAYRWNQDSTGGFESGLVPPANKWSMAALVVEAEMATLYLGTDGVLKSAANAIPHIQEVAWGLMANIGCDQHLASRAFQGVIDEVAMFDKALSAEQIAAVYRAASTKPASGPKLTITSGAGGTLLISWDGGGDLQSSPALQGANTVWTTLGATNPRTVIPAGSAQYYRVRVP